MKNRSRITDDDRWQSVVDRDVAADGQFVFAVRTTGIFCRPSCRAKHALRKNVSFFADARQALAAGFRPCKRCQPDKDSAQQHRLEKIAHACQLLEQESPLTLDELAQQVAMSPYHLHRLFKATTGMTPKAWQQSWRARRLRDALAKGVPVTQAILNAGFPDSSSYYRKSRSDVRHDRQSNFVKVATTFLYAIPWQIVRWGVVWWRKVNAVSARSYWVMMTLRWLRICMSCFPPLRICQQIPIFSSAYAK
ncbi:adaptative response regulatory protein Ada [Citrobacter freundii]|nr:adaptative response regulatory protein Ada [Citrobacter freundii]